LLASADGGATWRQVYRFAPDYIPGMLSFVDGDTGWVLADKDNQIAILKTTDGGRSWALPVSDFPPIFYSISYFRFFDADHGLIVTEGQQYRTQDGGRTWQTSEEEYPGSFFSFVTPEQGWQASCTLPFTAVTMSRTKNGSTWQSLPPVGSDTQLLGLDFISPDYGLLLVQEQPYSPQSRLNLLITTDGGRTWSAHPFPDNFGLEMLGDQVPLQFTDQQHGWILSLSGLLRTQDGGRTWTAE